MFCAQCRNELTAEARFCSRCGASVQPVKERKQHDWDMHVSVLGWLFVASAALIGVMGLMIVFAGHVLGAMSMAWPPGMPSGVRMLVAPLSTLVGLVIIALAAGLTAAGAGLFQYREWARILALVLSVFAVFHFPIGTVIAIYAFWVLLSEEGRAHYKMRSSLISTASH